MSKQKRPISAEASVQTDQSSSVIGFINHANEAAGKMCLSCLQNLFHALPNIYISFNSSTDQSNLFLLIT